MGFFKKAWEASFTSNNIESAWRATTLIKKTHVRFAFNKPLSLHAMRQLTHNGHLNP